MSRRVLEPVGAAVIAVFVLAAAGATGWWLSGGTARYGGELADLATAVGPDLPFDARLTGGFAPSSRRTLRNSAGAPPPNLSPDTRIAIAELEKRAAADPGPRAMAAVGVAYLVQGDVDRGISTLEDVTQTLNTAGPWSDLSAAYLVKAERAPQRRIEYLSRALEAAATSLRVAPSNEARFNRALALDGLAPFVGQAAPWAEYASAERDSRWVEAATRRLSDSKPAQDARDRWEARRRELDSEIAQRDRAFVDETAKLFPEASTDIFGQLILSWAKAMLAKDQSTARTAVDRAQFLAESIAAATGDKMPTEEIAAVRLGGPVLAQAHLDYADGVRAYNAVQYDVANDKLARARAGFVRGRSTYVAWADAMLATVLFQQRDLAGANRQLAAVEAISRERHYETLLGRALWLRGLVYSKDWRLTEAFGAFREAASCFERAGQYEFAVSIYSLLADTLRTLGESHESWESIGKTLEGLERVRAPQRRYLLLYNASLFASRQDLLEAALLFQDATVREAAKASAGIAVEALTQRAVIYERAGDSVNARRDLLDALERLDEVPEGQPKLFLRAEIDVLRSRLDRDGSSDSYEQQLSSAIAFFAKAEPARVPRLYLDLARNRLERRSVDLASDALADGIATLEKQQSGLSDDALRISYFDESWNLFQEMVALQHARTNSTKAFEYAERSRARSLLSTAAGEGSVRGLSEIRATLPQSVALIYYATLPDRLLVWAVTPAAERLVESRIQRDELSRLVAQHRAAMVERREGSGANDKLFDILLRPVADALKGHDTIVFVPDGSLQQLPFATLRDSATRRYLIEDRSVLVTPSASFYAAALARWQPPTGASSALLVGNPAARASAAAPTLAGAQAEVAEVARYYPRHVVLTGADATKERFVQAAPEYDVVHFGGHAFANAEYPMLSRLSFAGEGGDSERPLFAHEISRLRFSRTQVVVLAACSTAVGMVSRGEGAISVARPFLGAGVPTVVASQWDVDDVATRQLFVEFHRALSSTKNPAGALRAAQLSLLHGENRDLALPASWGAFVALGTTAR